MAESNQIYDDMRKESYKTLLNSEIQASVAKQNALKYTQNQLNQTGYGTQGLAQSTNLGITNNYRNAMVDAQNKYEQQMAGINKDEYDANQKEWANNGSNAIGDLESMANKSGTTIDDYKDYLSSYGVDFSSGDANFDNSKFTDSDRISISNVWKQIAKTYGGNENAAVANETYGLGYDNDGFFVGSNGASKDTIFNKDFDDISSMKVTGVAKGQNQKHDDDIDVDFKGKNYDLDIEWEGKGDKDGNQRITETTFNSAVAAIAKRYSNPQSDQFVVYKNMVFFYDKDRARWGYVQKNVGGKRLLTDLTTYLNGGSPSRWKSNQDTSNDLPRDMQTTNEWKKEK